MKSDIEIASMMEPISIEKIADRLGIEGKYVELYGSDKAKISLDILDSLQDKPNGKLILVTSINPTPYGEGKTTMAIGLHDAMNKMHVSSLLALREPSLGPVFGMKGGATGGGYAQVIPMEDINLHFTGDIHAITAANNLLCALIDNHIFQGNALQLDLNRIMMKRCLDMNDRSLRDVLIYKGTEYERVEHFQITAASELMAIVCLAENLMDLKDRISHILIGYRVDGNPVFVSDLHCEDAITILLKDALKPNLVQTLEGNPVLMHGGPFANIAHGCNSIIATKLALKLSDYVITEAGFGADLGAFKFLDIVCRRTGIYPDCIVMNVTVRALKYNGLCPKEKMDLCGVEYIQKGIENLRVHIENMKCYCSHVVICINHFQSDFEEEIEYIRNYCKDLGCDIALSDAYLKGGEGSLELAKTILNQSFSDCTVSPLYNLKEELSDKIDTVCRKMYRSIKIHYTDQAKQSMEMLKKYHLDTLPICIAKTQYSLTDDAQKLGFQEDSEMTVRDVSIANGSGFIIVYMGSIMTMPGLGKVPAAMNMKIDDSGKVQGLF